MTMTALSFTGPSPVLAPLRPPAPGAFRARVRFPSSAPSGPVSGCSEFGRSPASPLATVAVTTGRSGPARHHVRARCPPRLRVGSPRA